MTDYESRKKEIGQRIRQERECRGLTRKELLPKIYMSEQSHKTLLAWEDGDRLPDLVSLARMADLFQCDIGYLLCDYNQHTSAISDICEETGLSEESVAELIKRKIFGDTTLSRPLDALIYDSIYVNKSAEDTLRNYRAVLDLLLFFLDYHPVEENKVAVFSNGAICPANNRQIVGTAVIVDPQMVENAVLLEIQRALLSLRENLEKENKLHEKGSKEDKKNATNKK